jgi:hypothetical protein
VRYLSILEKVTLNTEGEVTCGTVGVSSVEAGDVIDNYNKVDIYNYINEIGQNWEDFDHETRCFESDAKAILKEDGFGQKSEFYLVAYLQNEDGKFEDIKKIKQLFY